MACAAEKYVLDNNFNWTIGENVMTNGQFLRSMYRPKLGNPKPQPDTYMGEYWADTSNLSQTSDYGGVHTNSGVQNKWFYLLSEGGSGSNDNRDSYTVKGIGIDMAAQIAYRNLVTYLTPTATFYDSREGSIAAAKDLYGVTSQAYKSVMDSWHAVGVGEDYNNTITYISPNLPDEQSPTTIKYMTNGKIFVKKGNDVYDMLGKKVK
jgi:Zn-dependent metalloprotease